LTLDKKKGRLAPFPRFGKELLEEENREFIARSLGLTDTKIRGSVSAEVRNPWRSSTPPLLFEGLPVRAKLM
jgi:hypothetical protein